MENIIFGLAILGGACLFLCLVNIFFPMKEPEESQKKIYTSGTSPADSYHRPGTSLYSLGNTHQPSFYTHERDEGGRIDTDAIIYDRSEISSDTETDAIIYDRSEISSDIDNLGWNDPE